MLPTAERGLGSGCPAPGLRTLRGWVSVPGAAKLLWTVPRVVLLAAGRFVVGAVSAFQTSFVPAKKRQTGFGLWNVAFADVQ